MIGKNQGLGFRVYMILYDWEWKTRTESSRGKFFVVDGTQQNITKCIT